MAINYLFLRGEYDEHNELNIKLDSDMWCQLFSEIVGNGFGAIWLKSDKKNVNFQYKNCRMFVGNHFPVCNDIDVVFARGGHPYYIPALEHYKKAFKLYYGAGVRRQPQDGVNYDITMVDTEKDLLSDKHKLLIKPAASCFRPIDVEKEYDVCFIANQQQRAFKGIDWVYSTAPVGLDILHLGYHDELRLDRSNIEQKRVDRIDMAKEISKCRVGIVPYGTVDSAPRVIPEMLACGLPLVILNEVNFELEDTCYSYDMLWFENKDYFWHYVYRYLKKSLSADEINKYYQENLSIPIAANHIKNLIKEAM